MRFSWAFLSCLLLPACATPAIQTEALLREPSDIPFTAHVGEVGFIEQDQYYCGPSTLAMAMGQAGHRVPVEELAAQVYTPGKKGSLQMDMISASRRQGMMAVQVQGMRNLTLELAAGHPVIVLQNLAFSWYPYWHYSLLLGYELGAEPAVFMHSGSQANKRQKMRNFERNWALAQFWGLVILPPGKLSATAGDLEHSAAAAGLEQAGAVEQAELAYRAILRRWPQSFGALFGLGNLAYERGNYRESVDFLRKAAAFHEREAVVWHNLAFAESAAKMNKRAQTSAARAVSLAPPHEIAVYQESLKQIATRY